MDIKKRVKARVDALGKSPITLARSVGLERGFINDILVGRKSSIRYDRLPLVAQALQCDPRYLTGDISTPTDTTNSGNDEPHPDIPGMTCLGVCETGVWRNANAMPPAYRVPHAPDSRFLDIDQVIYDVRGDGMSGADIDHGMQVLSLDYDQFTDLYRPLETGMVVVLRRERIGHDESEISLRRVDARSRLTRLEAVVRVDGPAFFSVSLEEPPEGEVLKPLGIVSYAFKACLERY